MNPSYPKSPMPAAKLHRKININEASTRNGDIELRDLVPFREVRIEVLFPIELGTQGDAAIQRKTKPDGELHDFGVENREGSGETHANRADGGVGLGAIGVGARAEGLGDGGELDMRLNADDGLEAMESRVGDLLVGRMDGFLLGR